MKTMRESGEVGAIGLTILLAVYTATDVFLSYPGRVAEQAKTSGWMVPLVAGVIALFAWIVIAWAMRSAGKEPLLSWMAGRIGPVAHVAAAIFFVYLLVETALVMREFTETVVSTVLPATPAEIVALLFAIVVVYFARQDLEGLVRVAIFFGALLLLGLVLLCVLPLNWFDGRLLLPLWGEGVSPTLQTGILATSMFATVPLLAIVGSRLQRAEALPWVGIVAICSSAVLISIVLAVFIGVFVGATEGRIPFPMYQVARLIYVGRFVQRLESLFVFVWTSAAVLKMGLALWTASYLYAWLFRMPVVRPIVAPLAALVFVLSFVPRDFTTLLYLSGSVVERYGGIVTIALPVCFIGAAGVLQLRRRRRRAA